MPWKRSTSAQKLVLVREAPSAAFGSAAGAARSRSGGSPSRPETDDMRESPSILLIEGLLAEGGTVVAHDPKAVDTAREVFGDRITLCRGPVCSAADGADALVIMTEWLVYRNPDFDRIKPLLRTPADRRRPEPVRARADEGARLPVPRHRTAARLRILVTGAAGFLGSHLSDRLLAEGHRGGRDGQLHHRAAATTCATSRATPNFDFVQHDVTKLHRTSTGRWTGSSTSPRRPARSTISSSRSRRSRSGRSAPTRRWGSPRPRAPGSSCVHLRGVRRSPGPSPAGELLGARESGRVRAACTTRPSASPRR